MKEMPLVKKYYVKFDWLKRSTKTEILLTWMIWYVAENKMEIAKKKDDEEMIQGKTNK
jgi:hypothetical protein